MKKVKCINKYSNLTFNEVYPVIYETEHIYCIQDKDGFNQEYLKRDFKEIDEINTEYTVQEVLEMPKGTILKLFPYDESEREIIVAEGIAGNKYLYYIDDESCHEEGVIISSWIMEKPRFKIVKSC
jgi:hypothetical protein